MKRLVRKILRVMPRPLLNLIRRVLLIVRYRNAMAMLRSVKGSRIILTGTPVHGNLGDHAIAKAAMKFLGDYFPDTPVIEITGEFYRNSKEQIAAHVHGDDTIIITGGGFLGSLWMAEETMVRDIIMRHPRNKIVILPQTVYFDDTAQGKAAFEESKRIYASHAKLTVCTRDEASYQMVSETMGIRCLFIPDMALYLEETSAGNDRKGIRLCLRDDRESAFSGGSPERIKQVAMAASEDVAGISTVEPSPILPAQRDAVLKSKFSAFRSARLIITDRLHGMLFAAITGTPCIAFDNISGKVSGVHRWLSRLDYIRFAGSLNEAEQLTGMLLAMGSRRYDASGLQSAFMTLEQAIGQPEPNREEA